MTVKRAMRALVTDAGWQSGTSLENSVSRWLHRAGFVPAVGMKCSDRCGGRGSRPSLCRCIYQQHRIGSYRVDFAATDIQVVIEADGWWHRSPEGAARDAERDSALRADGWVVLRVDDRHGTGSALDEQVVRVTSIIHALRSLA